ncbi:Down syndrome cell adhesion molecule-like protein Dscam2 [Blattella germanica]|nr:Down syndrome cell adhesion molecule-like protein Dscam2 [Blattella germanica]
MQLYCKQVIKILLLLLLLLLLLIKSKKKINYFIFTGLPYIRLIPKVTAVAGGRELPDDLRQKVQADGTLVIIPVQKATDAGVYTCSAKNKQGHSARRSGEVTVIVPPKLSAFTSDITQHVGERATLTCSVTKGDLPLTIEWQKDGRPLDSNQRVSITQVDQFNSILLIESLSPDHNGNYSCVARNLAAEVSRTQQLVVNVPPIIEPFSFQDGLSEGMRTRTVCGVSRGDPPLAITWLKDGGTISSHLGVNVSALDPYSSLLSISSLASTHSGDYTCVASNPAAEVRYTAKLQVKVPPRWVVEPTDASVERNKHVTLHCQAQGVPQPTVVWKKATGSKSGDYEELRERVYTKLLSNGSLLLQNVKEDREASPYFSAPSRSVMVKKGDTATLQCDVNGDKPINVIWLRGGKLELTPASNYRVSVKQDSTPEGVSAELQIAAAEAADSGAYFCQASNLYGRDQQLVQLLVQEPPRSPVNLESVMISSRSVNIQWKQPTSESTEVTKYLVQYQENNVRPVSSTELLVTWSPPLAELRHGDIQGYNVGYREISTNAVSYNFTSVGGDGEEGGGELLLGGLGKFTRYSVVVQAFNQVGPGPLSEAVSTQTMEDVPSVAPEDVRCAGLTAQSLQVSWQPPPTSQCNGILQGYKLFYEPVLDDHWQGVDEIETRKTTALTAVLTGLRRFTNYSVQVLAFTRVGDGVLTKSIFCTTEEDAPGSPADIKVVVSSPQSLLVSWLPPTEPNDGRDELNHGKRNLPSQHTSFEAKGLQQHVEYQFWVTASTRVGEGQSSKVVAQVPTSRVPARISSFGGPIVRPFRNTASLTCLAVGQPAPRREWMRGDQLLRGGTNHNVQIMDTGELLISNLQQGDSGNYTCQVDNNHGSDRIQYTLIVQVRPSAPTLYITSTTSSSILLHWKPGDNGGAPLSGYMLNYRRTHGDLEELTLPRRATSYELKGLYCGSTYHLYLAAQNKIGSSPPSPTLSVKTQGLAPGVPEAQTLLSPNSTSVLLRLHVWPDNGCPLTYFVVQYRPISKHHWTLVSNALKPQRRFIISGLAPASVYQLKIEAHNIAGSSTAEYTFVTLTKEGDPPPPELVKRGHTSQPFYSDLRVMVPLIIAILALLGAGTAAGLCWRNSKSQNSLQQLTNCHRSSVTLLVEFIDLPTLVPEQARPLKESLDNQQNAEAQRERYYATIHKVALQAGGDKIPGVKEALLKDAGTIVSITDIPETSEDISPYATFQLSGPGGDPNNTLLHSFMYHEQAMTEGCASPPPTGVVKSSRRRGSRKTDVDTDDSDSDPDQLTSSRTESSNQLDAGKIKHNFIYHGAQSSTSSDISPMSEQKSLPRRGRSRWLVPSRASLRTLLPPLTVAETTFGVRQPQSESGETPDRPELSEAECDIDTLKKLKLGLRSSLWSRPNTHNNQSDYSIAV